MKDITSIITKGTTPLDKSGNGDINFIKIENINPSTGIIESTSKITEEEHNGYLRRSQLKENDLLFSIAGTLGRVSLVNKEILPANTNQALAIIRLKECDLNYIKTFLKGKAISDFIKKNPTIGAQPNLSLEQVSNFEISYPEDTEAHKIGIMLDSLDNLITLHQRKSYEKIYDWEQRKFDEITYLSGEKNKNNLALTSYSISNEKGFIEQDIQFENGGTMRDADKSMYIIVSPNSFAYNPARINIGSIGYYDKPEKVIVSSLYEVFSTYQDIDDRFLWHWFKSPHFPRFIEKFQEGGVRQYFYYNKLLLCDMKIPELVEQKKIGQTLDNIDNLITLHQRICLLII